MNRRKMMAAGAVAPMLAIPALTHAQTRIRWRFPGSFPKSLDTLYGTQERIARRVREMTDGAFEMTPFGPGEVVPALQVMDAVGQGSVECGYTSAYYYLGKDPSLCIATCLPFGMNSRSLWSWLNEGGGRDALREVYRDQGVIAIPAGNTGAQMGGWFRREITSVADLNGLKFRIAGFGGNILQRVGVVPQLIGGADIYPALERGVIDGAEWVGPHDDEKLGFQRVARFYYAPGWWEYAPNIDLMINPAAYEALPTNYKHILEAACQEAWHWMMARYDALNPVALRRLVAGGTQLRLFPREVLNASYRAAQEFYQETGAANPRFRRIHQTWDAFRVDQTQWFRIAVDSQANFLAVASAPR